MAGKKLNESYYQPDHLWIGGKGIRELHKITFIPKADIKRWLAKQALWQAHISPPKENNHPSYDVTKSNEQHQFDLLYVLHNNFGGNTYKYILTGVDVASDTRWLEPLEQRKQVRLHLCWKQYIKRVVFLNTQRCFNVIMRLSLQLM